MDKIKVAFICHFSNKELRQSLTLRTRKFENFIRSILGKSELKYKDFAHWVPLLCQCFKKTEDMELHIIFPFKGLKRKYETFKKDNIIYHAVQCKDGQISRYIKKFSLLYSSNFYKSNYNKINNIINSINTDVICLCGAENLNYSPSILYINNKPIYVLLQTLLNSQKYLDYNVGNEDRRKYENLIIKKANYIGTNDIYSIYVKSINQNVSLFKVSFPVETPHRINPVSYDSEFVYYSIELTKNKGIEDTIDAFAIVCNKFPLARIRIIGKYKVDYKKFLDSKIIRLGLSANVEFLGFFENHEDVFSEVSKAKYVISPGITAIFNSTVRESMFLGIPTITYKSCNYSCFDNNGEYLLFAEMGNKQQLGEKMIYALEHPTEMSEMASRAYDYAKKNFDAKTNSQKLISDIRAIYNNYYHNQAIPNDLFLS